jgi:glycosyltransferase involved in cell wall biosynthesis
MIIGIDASRAFLAQRTGIEEYSYQVIKHLVEKLDGHEVVLYIREDTRYKIQDTNKSQITNHPGRAGKSQTDSVNRFKGFELPKNWKIKVIKLPYLWTQIGLSLELLLHPVNILFIPAHTVPLIHPKSTTVAIHGLEYEFCPEAYSFWARTYMRWSIKMSCRWAKKIIAVSENTKKDLMRLYKVPEKKIEVIYEGYEKDLSFRAEPERAKRVEGEVEESNFGLDPSTSSAADFAQDDSKKFILFIGRLEERKNIVGIVRAFEILKEHYKISHKLILAGKFGYGAEKIKAEIKNINCAKDIILPGYISEEEKWEMLKRADVFLFPTFYEGFGIPVLEAQSVGVPVVTGDNSSIPEVVGARRDEADGRDEAVPRLYGSAILVDPLNAEQIADETYRLISDKTLRDDIIKKGYENARRFSWDKCGKEIARVLVG